VNQLIDLEAALSSNSHARGVMSEAPRALRDGTHNPPYNEFSSPEYRIINFVADLPLRIERLMPKADIPPDLSHVVFVLTEFQVADKETAQANENGARSHEAYKQRQHERVRMRLFRAEDDPLPPD